jgi:O-antigen/teichoic acid export membrane protein
MDKKNPERRRGFFKDSSIYLSANILTMAVSFFTLPIYTRYLSPADYGIIALFLMFGSVSCGLLSVGIHAATYRYYFKFKDDHDGFNVLNSSNMLFLLIGFLLTGITIYHLASWFSTTLFKDQITEKLLRWSFLNGCMGYLFTYLTLLLTAQTRSIEFAVIIVLRTLLDTAFAFYFIFLHSLTYLAKIYSSLLTQGIMIFCLLFLLRNLFSIRFSFKSLKKSLSFSYPLLPRQLIGLTYKSFDKIMLNRHGGLVSLGYYTFGVKFATLLKMAMDSVNKVYTPFFLSKAHENTNEAKRAIVSRFYEMAFCFAVAGLGIIYFSEEMIKFLTTKEFYPSMYIVPVYVYLHLFGIMNILTYNQIMHAEKMTSVLPAAIASVILNIIMNLLLIPKYGAVGAALATAMAALASSMILLYFGFRVYPLPIGKWKLTFLFLLLIAFTAPIYPIMAADIHFIAKVCVKTFMILLFIILCIKLNYIHLKQIKILFNKIFGQMGLNYKFQS